MNIFDLSTIIIGIFCVACGLSYLFVAHFIAKDQKSKKMYKIVGWILFIFGAIFAIEKFIL